MSIVDFNTSIWSNPWFRKLECDERLLCLYLKTNNHMLHTGLYPVDIDTMSFDTKLPADIINDLLKKLHPEIQYDPKNALVLVVNHVKEQFLKKDDHVSPKILIALQKALRAVPAEHPFVVEFQKKYNALGIPDTVSALPDTLSGYCTGKGKGKDSGKGEEKVKYILNPKETEDITECKSPPWDEIGRKGR